MEQNTKFDGIDYMKSFASKISTMHELIKTLLQDHICDGDIVIDIGGGPGMGARIIEDLGKKAVVINIEPSTTIYDVPQLSTVEYIPLKMSMKEALNVKMPYTPDCLLMVSSAHEIALCNNAQAFENKRVFFEDLNNFIKKNLKPNGIIIIGFPNYYKGATQSEIDRQRKLTESVFGHSHPSNEFFLLEEFSVALGMQPVVHIQRPMDIAPSSSQKTVLMANGVIFVSTSNLRVISTSL
ncbi:MAG: class I SAM-dependent methyltransferase [Methanosarcinales archaeon]|nr:class I SAM-dependent methyltransferase [Methanosarcinales archaeon]